jgi:type I restriction enzyme R subunit
VAVPAASASSGPLPPFGALGTPVELVRAFGGTAGFAKAIAALEEALYGEG